MTFDLHNWNWFDKWKNDVKKGDIVNCKTKLNLVKTNTKKTDEIENLMNPSLKAN